MSSAPASSCCSAQISTNTHATESKGEVQRQGKEFNRESESRKCRKSEMNLDDWVRVKRLVRLLLSLRRSLELICMEKYAQPVGKHTSLFEPGAASVFDDFVADSWRNKIAVDEVSLDAALSTRTTE